MKQDDFKQSTSSDDMFKPTPGKQSDKTFQKEKTIAKTKTTWRYGFHIIGKWYMVVLVAMIVGTGYLFVTDADYQPLFAILIIAYFVIVGLTLASIPSREIILTDRRLLYKSGGAKGTSQDIPFEKILNIVPLTPTLGRAFKYGVLDIVMDDQANIETIYGVEDHEAFSEKSVKALVDHANATRDHAKSVQRQRVRESMGKK